MPEPAELIEVAKHLVRRSTTEALRRAVSTTYYALFHCLAGHAADRFVGKGDTSAAYTIVYRSLDHTRIRSVLIELGKSNLKPAYRKALRRASVSPAFRDFADIFIQLQELRHLADYDPFLPPLSPDEVSALVDEAARALHDFVALDPEELTDVLALISSASAHSASHLTVALP